MNQWGSWGTVTVHRCNTIGPEDSRQDAERLTQRLTRAMKRATVSKTTSLPGPRITRWRSLGTVERTLSREPRRLSRILPTTGSTSGSWSDWRTRVGAVTRPRFDLQLRAARRSSRRLRT